MIIGIAVIITIAIPIYALVWYFTNIAMQQWMPLHLHLVAMQGHAVNSVTRLAIGLWKVMVWLGWLLYLGVIGSGVVLKVPRWKDRFTEGTKEWLVIGRAVGWTLFLLGYFVIYMGFIYAWIELVTTVAAK
jgi:hypothetical protein